MALEFFWDKKSQRYKYKDSGKFVGKEAVQNLTQKAIALVNTDINTIGDLLVQGKISVTTWEQETAFALKKAHTWNYLIGVGGKHQMTQRDYGILGNQLKSQYEYLRGFSEDLRAGGMTEDQFRARLKLYTEAARGSQERSKLESHRNSGYTWERRRRTKSNSCSPCINYASLGWQAIGTLPNPMQECDCYSNCGCYKEFSKTTKRPEDFLRQRFGWTGQPLKRSLRLA